MLPPKTVKGMGVNILKFVDLPLKWVVMALVEVGGELAGILYSTEAQLGVQGCREVSRGEEVDVSW